MPLSWPSWLSLVSSAAGDSVSPSIATGSPRLEIDGDRSSPGPARPRARSCAGGHIRALRLPGPRAPSLPMTSAAGWRRPRGRLAALVLGDRDLVLLGEVDQLLAALEFPLAPRCDHADVGLQRIIAELEAHLVVALAGRAMADGVRAHRPRNLDLALGDQRPRDRRAEQIVALVLRVGAEHREDEVADELLAQILDEDVFRLHAEHLGLAPRRFDLLALAEVGGEGYDLRVIFGLQPLEDDRGVEPARISEHDLQLRVSLACSSIQSMAPRAVCIRFSACRQTAERGPSITGAVTSSPRRAGRQ